MGILAALTARQPQAVAEGYAGASASAFKADLTDALIATVAPIRERLRRWQREPSAVQAVLDQGAAAARDMAAATMAEVRARAGVF